MARTLHVKKGDVVRVVAGKDRGAKGKVLQVYPDKDRVLVEGVNRVKRHTKTVEATGRAAKSGGIVTQEAPIHVSNVRLVVEVDGTEVPTRVGYRLVDVEKKRADGTTYQGRRSVRYAKRTGEEL